MSALADIQKMVEAGTDPESVLNPAEKEAAERARKEEEEREKVEQEDSRQRQRQRAAGQGVGNKEDEAFDVDDL